MKDALIAAGLVAGFTFVVTVLGVLLGVALVLVVKWSGSKQKSLDDTQGRSDDPASGSVNKQPSSLPVRRTSHWGSGGPGVSS